MHRKFAVYKGLERPLIYKGLKGKFIAWGIGSLVIGVVTGGVLSTLVNMYLGGFAALTLTTVGIALTFSKQKNGLHNKTRTSGILIHPNHLKICYAYAEKNKL